MATSRTESRIARAIDVAHPARTDKRDDLVMTEPRPWSGAFHNATPICSVPFPSRQDQALHRKPVFRCRPRRQVEFVDQVFEETWEARPGISVQGSGVPRPVDCWRGGNQSTAGRGTREDRRVERHADQSFRRVGHPRRPCDSELTQTGRSRRSATRRKNQYQDASDRDHRNATPAPRPAGCVCGASSAATVCGAFARGMPRDRSRSGECGYLLRPVQSRVDGRRRAHRCRDTRW